MKKKILIVLGTLVGLFIVAAIVTPFVVDVDQFRPQIVQAVNDQINGDFKLGKLQLSLWGGVKVKIESLSLSAKGASTPLLATNSAYLDIPLTSLLAMSPAVVVVIDKPEIHIQKQKDGKFDVMTLMKAQSPEPVPAAPPSTASSVLPAIAVNASLGLKIHDGAFSLNDQTNGSKYQIDGLQVEIKNVGLKETMQLNVRMPLKGSSAMMNMDGEIEMHGQIKPNIAGGAFENAVGQFEIDATKLSLSMNQGMVEKSAKTPAQIKMDFVASPKDLQIKSLDILFAEISASISGSVVLQPEMSVNLDIHSTQLNLATLEQIVPMLKEYELAGAGALKIAVKGPTSQLDIHGGLQVKGGKASYPKMLKGPIAYDLDTVFTENTFDVSRLTATAPGSNFNVKMAVKNFVAPVVSFSLTSQELDIDKLLKSDPAPTAAKKSASYWMNPFIETAEAAPKHGTKNSSKQPAKHAPAKEPAAASPVAASGANPFLPLAKNPMMAQASVAGTATIAKLVAKGSTISDVVVKMTLKNLILNIESASLKAFDGKMNAKFDANLKSAGLSFNTSGTVQGLMLKNAITHFVPSFQNTLEGTGNANWVLSGVAFPTANALQNLNGHFNLGAENGQLHTIDIQKSISGALDKVPFLKGKTVSGLDQGFHHMKAEIKFSEGVIDANPLEVIGNEKGLNIKGRSRILASNMTQDTFVDVFDPHMLLPKEISNGKDAALSLHITGPVSAPQTDYGYTVERLAKVVVKNQGKELINKGLQGIIGGAAKGGSGGGGDPTKDAVKGVLKGLGF